MPGRLKEDEIEAWITRGGSKIPIPTKEAAERHGDVADRPHLPSAAGQKAKDTKEAKGEEKETPKVKGVTKYFQRHAVIKTPFKIRDDVVYDKEKMGKVAGFVGEMIKILDQRGVIIARHKDYVYKSDEMIGDIHWDSMTDVDRVIQLKDHSLPDHYYKSEWALIPIPIRKLIKAQGPAGYEGGGVTTVVQGVFNPVHQDMSLSERMKEQEKQAKAKPKGQKMSAERSFTD